MDRPVVTRPRPGHADLAGVAKYGHEDVRNVLERASARETASRVAVGSIARQLLLHFGTEIVSHVASLGDASIPDVLAVTFEDIEAIPSDSPLHCVDRKLEARMIAAIDAAREAGDTLGGSFEVIARGVPVGLGSHVQWDRKLDGRLGQALMSIPAIKAVGIGRGYGVAALPGSRIHDEILPPTPVHRSSQLPVERPTNNAGSKSSPLRPQCCTKMTVPDCSRTLAARRLMRSTTPRKSCLRSPLRSPTCMSTTNIASIGMPETG